MNSARRVLVVIPTYQEAASIEAVLRAVRTNLPDAHILVVDDSSPDGTAALVERIGVEVGGVDVLSGRPKSGLGSAYRSGFAWGLERGFDVLVEMDADGSHDPASLPDLVAAVDAGADLAVGSRYVKGGSIPEWSWHRRALSRWGNRYAGAVLGIKVKDATSGFRAYRAPMVERIDLGTVRADGYGFQIEMVHRIAAAGGVIVEVPIAFTDRVDGESKMGPEIIIEALALVTLWGARDRLHRLRRRSATADAGARAKAR